MIVVKEISINQWSKKADCDIFADTKSEVTPSAEIVGLPNGVTIAEGSSLMTADGELAFMKSDGTWNWV